MHDNRGPVYDSHSWFVACNKLLHKYSLPKYLTVKTEFESESQFKQQVKTKLDKYIRDSWLSSAEEKKSLSFLNVEDCSVGNVHPCWSTVDNTVMDVRRAVMKARILTGTYYLQADGDLNLNLNSLVVKRQVDNPSPGAVTGGN